MINDTHVETWSLFKKNFWNSKVETFDARSQSAMHFRHSRIFEHRCSNAIVYRSINICSAGTHKIERTEEPIDYTSMKIASPFSTAGFRVIFISNDLHLARVTIGNDRATFGCIITENARTSCSRFVGIPSQYFRLHSILFLFPVCHESTIFPPYIWLMHMYRW